MNNFNAIAPVALICRVGGRKPLIAAIAAIAIAAALLGGVRHSQVYADSPTPTPARASQPSDADAHTLRRYTLQLLHILSDADSNRWERYRQAIAHCASPPAYLGEIGADSDVSPLDHAVAAMTEDLCADLDQRLEDARTVGLLMNEPQAMRGYTLITGFSDNYVHLVDHLGRIAHSWQLGRRIAHAKLMDNGNLLVQLGRGEELSILDPDSGIVWKYTHTGNFHHDFLKMPNGNLLMIARGFKSREEAIQAGVNPDVVPLEGMEYDYLIEVRPTGSDDGEIVWEWSAWDYIVQDFDASKENYGDPSDHPELIDVNFLVKSSRGRGRNTLNWLHTNAIDYNPSLNQIILSPRNNDELWIIDRSVSTKIAPTRKGGNAGKGGALLYRWGNPRAYRHGTTDDQRLFRQHHTQWIAPGLPGAGNILVFNNKNEFAADQRKNYSSIEEIVPPTDGSEYKREPGAAYPPVEPVWTYTAEPPSDFYSSVMGCVQRLPNGNTLICDSTSGAVFQVTPDGTTVWKYVYPIRGDIPLKQGEEVDADNSFVYRAYWYAPDYPGLQKYDLTPGDTIELYE